MAPCRPCSRFAHRRHASVDLHASKPRCLHCLLVSHPDSTATACACHGLEVQVVCTFVSITHVVTEGAPRRCRVAKGAVPCPHFGRPSICLCEMADLREGPSSDFRCLTRFLCCTDPADPGRHCHQHGGFHWVRPVWPAVTVACRTSGHGCCPYRAHSVQSSGT